MILHKVTHISTTNDLSLKHGSSHISRGWHGKRWNNQLCITETRSRVGTRAQSHTKVHRGLSNIAEQEAPSHLSETRGIACNPKTWYELNNSKEGLNLAPLALARVEQKLPRYASYSWNMARSSAPNKTAKSSTSYIGKYISDKLERAYTKQTRLDPISKLVSKKIQTVHELFRAHSGKYNHHQKTSTRVSARHLILCRCS